MLQIWYMDIKQKALIHKKIGCKNAQISDIDMAYRYNSYNYKQSIQSSYSYMK